MCSEERGKVDLVVALSLSLIMNFVAFFIQSFPEGKPASQVRPVKSKTLFSLEVKCL